MGQVIQFRPRQRQRNIYTAIVEQANAQRQEKPEPNCNVTALITVDELLELIDPQ